MQLLWIDINSSYSHSSFALPAIEAQKEDNDGVVWNTVSATLHTDIATIVEEATRYCPDIITATAWLFNHNHLLEVISRLKSLFPKAIVLLGGPEFLGDNRDYLIHHSYIDAVFRGEGELEFHRWLKIVHSPNKWKQIKGLCYLTSEGVYHDNGICKIENFTALTPPENSSFFHWDKPFIQLETTRGCFNTCAFCVSGNDKPLRSLPIETIRKRLDKACEKGIRNVRLLDRTFNGNEARALQLLQLFEKYAGKICFHLEIHPALLTDKIKNLLKQISPGTLHLEAGIQSLREEVLNVCQRKGDLKKALEGLKFLCSLSNMETHADLIAGLPLYSLPQIYEDITVLSSFGAGEIQLESLKLLPGTEMRKKASEQGIIFSPLPPYEVLQTKWMSVTALKESEMLSRLLDHFYNNKTWQPVIRKLIGSDNRFLKRFLDFLTPLDILYQPLSQEKRGMLLYEFCATDYPQFITEISIAWLNAGLSHKKAPALNLKPYTKPLPENITAIKGLATDSMRFYFLSDNFHNYFFGFDRSIKHSEPLFIGITPKEKKE